MEAMTVISELMYPKTSTPMEVTFFDPEGEGQFRLRCELIFKVDDYCILKVKEVLELSPRDLKLEVGPGDYFWALKSHVLGDRARIPMGKMQVWNRLRKKR